MPRRSLNNKMEVFYAQIYHPRPVSGRHHRGGVCGSHPDPAHPAFTGIQVRLSEALTVLPFLFPATAPGLVVGCFIANLFSPIPWT